MKVFLPNNRIENLPAVVHSKLRADIKINITRNNAQKQLEQQNTAVHAAVKNNAVHTARDGAVHNAARNQRGKNPDERKDSVKNNN